MDLVCEELLQARRVWLNGSGWRFGGRDVERSRTDALMLLVGDEATRLVR
jgi:hypothetical protein